MSDAVKLHPSWRLPLTDHFESAPMAALRAFLEAEKAAGKRIFPRGSEWFRALDLTPLGSVRVVILGQDPYHGEGQAHGLCFSVPTGIRPPPSLGNIYKELETDLGIPRAQHGNLESWAKQGVLLLNSVLTVEMAQAASHKGRGWEEFTDAVISTLKTEVMNSKKIKKGDYFIMVDYAIELDGKVTINNVYPTPENKFIEEQVKERFSIDTPQLNPVLASNGKPRKVNKRQNFTLTKE